MFEVWGRFFSYTVAERNDERTCAAFASRRAYAPTDAQLEVVKESGFKLDLQAKISADELNDIFKLDGQPPREQHMGLFRLHGITYFNGDAFAAYAMGILIRYFEDLAVEEGGDGRIMNACMAAMRDPAYGEPTLTRNKLKQVTFLWPKRKLKQWYREEA